MRRIKWDDEFRVLISPLAGGILQDCLLCEFYINCSHKQWLWSSPTTPSSWDFSADDAVEAAHNGKLDLPAPAPHVGGSEKSLNNSFDNWAFEEFTEIELRKWESRKISPPSVIHPLRVGVRLSFTAYFSIYFPWSLNDSHKRLLILPLGQYYKRPHC